MKTQPRQYTPRTRSLRPLLPCGAGAAQHATSGKASKFKGRAHVTPLPLMRCSLEDFFWPIFYQNLKNKLSHFFKKSGPFSRASPVVLTHEVVTLCALTRLGSIVTQNPPHGPSHVAGVTLSDMMRLSHASPFSVTSPPRSSRPSSFLLSLSFFLFHLVAAPLAIWDFSSLIGACAVTNRLYKLVFQSCWVRTSSLSSHFLIFWNFCLDEFMW
jgi:hypothetical protein